jgi:hypothetical protein
MNGDLVLEAEERAVLSEIVADDGLKGCRNKEILLSKTKKLTLIIIISGIKLLGDLLRVVVIHINDVIIMSGSFAVEL